MKALPFTIPSVGNSSFLIQEDRLEGFYPYLHRHDEVQVCWIKKGHGTLIVQAEVFEFQEGDIFVIGSNKAHLFKSVNSQEGIESVSLFFGVDKSKNALVEVPELRGLFYRYSQLAPCNKITTEKRAFFQRKLAMLLRKSNEEKLIHFLQILFDLLENLRLEKEFVLPYSEEDGDRMKEIMTYTLRHQSEEITIKQIAQIIGYTPEAFCRFFKRRTGKTYIRYLNELRINESCRRILESSDPNIAQIAFESGYNNVSHFNRVFKSIKGVSPLRFKKNIEIK